MAAVTPGAKIVELTTGVYARLHEGLTNAGIIVGDDGVLVIDSLRVPSFARDLIADVKHLSDKPITHVIDTHSHWDHSWGNEEFPDSTIIGHENCRAEMLDLEKLDAWRDKVVSSNEGWSEEAKTVQVTPPNLTFETSMQLYFGGRRIDLRYLGRAHTGGDIFIHLPDDRLLFTGDVAQDGGIPFMMDGYIQDWVGTDARLLELDCERFMAGHGPIGERPAIAEAAQFINALAAGTKQAIAESQDEATAAAGVTEALSERFGSWRGFERVEESVAFAFREISNS
ncbi:MAG TPA: MBL fold metallo-hydrolase [Dehalococcoidia bacterium]|nr:MBL fold metallo-hydrolase [Dehalococcoidia bacterium]